MYGHSAPIEKLQTTTGTKDKIAQHWIEILLTKARQMKADNPTQSRDDIAAKLREWFKEQPGDKINPLLLLEGRVPWLCLAQVVQKLTFSHDQALILHKILLLKFYTQFCWGSSNIFGTISIHRGMRHSKTCLSFACNPQTLMD